MNLLINKYFKRILISVLLLASSTTFANDLENKEYSIDFSELGYGAIVTDQYTNLGLLVSVEDDEDIQFPEVFDGWDLTDGELYLSNMNNDLLRLTFSTDVNSVSFDFDGWGCEPVTFLAYDSNGEVLEEITMNCEGIVSFSNNNIAMIEGYTLVENWHFGINNLTYSTSTELTLPQTTPIEFTITNSHAGYDAFGVDCDISLNSDDNCGTPEDLNNQQAVYVSHSIIEGSQKVLTIGYASDDATTTGFHFDLTIDSSKLRLITSECGITEEHDHVLNCGVLSEENTFSFGWASLFGSWPGTNQANLATLTFDIVGYEPPTQPQQIISVNNTPKGVLGRTSVLEVAYDTSDNNNQLSGLGMRVHFDSSLISFNEITGLIEQDVIVDGQGPFSDDADFDNDPLTDQYILFGWASLYNNWPNTELPTVLMNIAFDVSDNIDTNLISSTNINFTDTSFTAGYEFSAESYQLDILKATWDFDGNGQADALSDGLMMLRYLFGLRGDLVTNSAMSPESPLSSEDIVSEIEAAMDVADIDADGELNALTDGLLLLRYLFGLRDDILTNGAVGPGATRSSNEDIHNYLESHMPNSLPIVPGAPADFTEAFGGTIISEDGTTFQFPVSAEVWGGFAHINTDLFPLAFSEAGTITFNASVPSGGSADIRFRLEYQPYPNVDPAYDAAAITVSGADVASYTVAIPSQGANTFSSLIMYIDDRDVEVIVTDVIVTSDSNVVIEKPVGSTILEVGDAIDFESEITIESFGGANGSIADGVLTVVKDAGAYTWAGNVIARGDVVFPLTATDTLITAEVHSTVPATIRMKLELAADGSQSAEVDSTVAHTGSGWETLTFDFAGTNAIDANFDVLVLFPSFGVDGAGNTYQYDNITFVGGTAAAPETIAVTFQVDMSAVETHPEGVYLFLPYGTNHENPQDGYLMSDNGSDVWSVILDLDPNTQYMYKFRNQPSYGTWDGFEDPAGLIEGGCAFGDYNDRSIEIATTDMILPTVAYGSCTAEPYIPPVIPEPPIAPPIAPIPTVAADSVLSVFSSTYGNLDGTDFNPNWGQSTSVEIGDNLVYSNLNYQGTQFANQDVSGYEYLNVDYYVDYGPYFESSEINFYLISPGAEKPFALDLSSAEQWNSVQIPLSYFENVNLADVFMFKVDGNGSVAFNNIFFGGAASEIDPIYPSTADFSIAFGGAEISESGTSFTFPSYADSWGGFANVNNGIYPLQFSEAGSITFNASVADGGSANIRFRLEYNVYPDMEPSFNAATVTVTGSEVTSYTVAIPPQGANTFSSMVMYIDERDVAVTITDVKVNSD